MTFVSSISDTLRKLSRVEKPPSLLVTGAFYSGRYHTLKEYVSYISSIPLTEIPQLDIPTASYPLSLPQLREFLSESISQPLRLPFRFPCIRDFDLFSKAHQDLFLKVLEDRPPHVIPLLTANDSNGVIAPVRSRVISLSIPLPSPSQLKTFPLLKDIPLLSTPLASIMSASLDFPSFVSRLRTLPAPFEVQEMVSSLLRNLESLSYPTSLTYPSLLSDLFIPCLLTLGEDDTLFRKALMKTLRNFKPSLFRYVSHPQRDFFISFRNQFTSLLNSITYLRRLYHV